ncbi:60S ribosomal protein L7a-like [Myzus persicae]|uniref:60S ribosomal protein L7a-like n=1 Tax=Myzus persicae TaxID=13164 RepID=UPI000B936DBA|nr:60S ribosomal protein L7a-like [Myzus persicae]
MAPKKPSSSKKVGKKAKIAPAPLVSEKPKKVLKQKVVNPLFEKRPRNFGIGKFILFLIIYYLF